MPKDRRVTSSFDRATVSPYSCSLKIANGSNRTSPLVGDEREWEEVRCPICMEHPHNAVLLLCSSRDKGCRPFICDTSYRHSNCFDQLRKSKSADASSLQTSFNKQKCELVCPLCRGLITGWDVIHTARKFMNTKTRSCSLETCSFNGNYADLRKHARLEHPSGRPSEASPNRQLNWATLEARRDIEDAFGYQSDVEYDFDGLPTFEEWEDDIWGDDIWGHDIWSPESFFDGMSDIENDPIDEMFQFVLSLSRLRSSSPDASTNSWGSILPTVAHTPRSILSYRTEESAVQSSGLGMENGSTNSNPNPDYRNRARYPRENASTNLRSNDPTRLSTRSSFQRENASSRARSRSYYHGEYGSLLPRMTFRRSEEAYSPARPARRIHSRDSSRRPPSRRRRE